MNNLIRIIPRPLLIFIKRIKYLFLLIEPYRNKIFRDLHFSSTFSHLQAAELSTLLIKSHVLEKIITMPDRQLGRGQQRVMEVLQHTQEMVKMYGSESLPVQAAIADLKQYLDIHRKGGFKLPQDIEKGIESLIPLLTNNDDNCYSITSEEQFREAKDFADFAHLRHSVRQFSNKPVDKDLLLKAIELALSAPSACNRQATRVKIIINTEKRQEIARHIHNGSQGFGENIPVWLLITSEQGAWSYLDADQCFIDAGIFTMNLLYSLQYYGLAACSLNAKMDDKKQKQLRLLLGYPESEIPVLFVGVGLPEKEYMVAKSRRFGVSEIATLN